MVEVQGIRAILRVLTAVVVCLVLLWSTSSADTLAVPADYPTISSAARSAEYGDIILVACGTYYESDIIIKSGVSLWSGTLQPGCVTIDAAKQGRCLVFVDTDSTTSVVGFTLRNGRAPESDTARAGGGALIVRSSPRLTRCVFTENFASAGGAVACRDESAPFFDRCLFTANQARVSGGALAASRSEILLKECLLTDNVAGNTGGALWLADATAGLTSCVVAHNTGGIGGGALAGFDGEATLRRCTLAANTADGAGAAILGRRLAATIDRTLITGNRNPILSVTDTPPDITRSNIRVAQRAGWPEELGLPADDAGNLSVDPLYCSAETRDYHLAPNSPCLGDDPDSTIGALGGGCGTLFPPGVIE